MAKKKTTVYSGTEMHVSCLVQFTRTRLEDRTIVRCPKCNFIHVSMHVEDSDEKKLSE